MNILETERLILRELSIADAAFILELVNEPAWLRFIGDKGVRTIAEACDYILNGPVASYKRFGFGLYLTALKENGDIDKKQKEKSKRQYSTAPKEDGIPIGICGLIKREALKDVDLGFAFLEKFWGNGYAHEAAAAMTTLAKNTLGLNRLVAVTTPENHGSIKVLEKVGFKFERMVRLSEEAAELKLFALDVGANF